MNKIYTFNINLTEKEILRREFGLELYDLNIENIKLKISNQKTVLLATSSVKDLAKILSACYPNSAVIFLFGNETYDVEAFMFLNQYKRKIKYGFIYNLPCSSSYIQVLRPMLGTAYDLDLAIFRQVKPYCRNLKNGYDLLKRTRQIKIEFPHLEFPQGYSTRFAKELELSGFIGVEESILKTVFPANSNRKHEITFVGQEGSWYRQLVFRLTKQQVSNFQPLITLGWGGEYQGDKTTYVDSLLGSRFVLNPPGNLTNKTHRYLESLLMGALPILPPATIQDPHLWQVWSEKNGIYSWKRLFKHLHSIDELTRIQLVEDALKVEIEKFTKIKDVLKKLLDSETE